MQSGESSIKFQICNGTQTFIMFLGNPIEKSRTSYEAKQVWPIFPKIHQNFIIETSKFHFLHVKQA